MSENYTEVWSQIWKVTVIEMVTSSYGTLLSWIRHEVETNTAIIYTPLNFILHASYDTEICDPIIIGG